MSLQDAIILAYEPSKDLHVHVFFPADVAPAPGGCPALVFFHGGGLFMGNAEINEWVPKWLFEEMAKRGVAIISAEYTLLSPYTGHDIIEDVKTLWTYIGTTLNKDLAGKTSLRIDPKRLAVAGSSAGGYLTYLSAIYASSTPAKPLAALPIYAMGGCYLSDFYVKPKQKDFPFRPENSEQEAEEWLASPPSVRAVRTSLSGEGEGHRPSMFGWILVWGNFVDVLTGVKGLSEGKLRSAALSDRAALLPQESRALFPECIVSKDLPPFFLLHGDGDSMVLSEESKYMAGKLNEVGVKTELILVPGADHGFDSGPAEDDTDGSVYRGRIKQYLVPLAEQFSKAWL